MLLILLVFLEESEESCQITSQRGSSFRFNNKLTYIQCKALSPENDLRGEILPLTGTNPVPIIELLNSSIPEITQDIFKGMSFTTMRIEANVQLVQEKAFENCNVATLKLDNNRIQKLKWNSFNTTALTVLSISNNSISEIREENFKGATNLRYLSLRKNRLIDIQPNAFEDLQRLEEIDLSYNQLNYLPLNLFRNSKYLDKVYLNNNNFEELQADIFAENQLLHNLFLQNNYFTSFDGRHFPLSLLSIDLSYNIINTINASNLVNLNILILDSNKLTNINDCLLNMPNLTQLQLNHNNVGSSFNSKTFGHLKNLSSLEFGDNQLLNFDIKYIKEQTSLFTFSLAENNISFLNFSSVSLKIKNLNISHNVIEDIRNLSLLKNLESLEMSYNKLDEITFDMFGGLYNLKQLSVQYNSIEALQSGCFRDLYSLIELDLSYNKLSTISTGVLHGMHSLSKLKLSHNNMKDLDEDIFHSTTNLKYLDFSFNNFSNINVRAILSHTKWLREINLNGNNWTCRDLITIIRDNRGLLYLSSGSTYNVSNVNGIPCNESNNPDKDFNTIQYSKDIYFVISNTMKVSEEMSNKFTVVSVSLFMILLVLVVKFLYENYSDKVHIPKQFINKKTMSEQELALL